MYTTTPTANHRAATSANTVTWVNNTGSATTTNGYLQWPPFEPITPTPLHFRARIVQLLLRAARVAQR